MVAMQAFYAPHPHPFINMPTLFSENITVWRLFEKQEKEKVEASVPIHKPGKLNRQSFTQIFADSR